MITDTHRIRVHVGKVLKHIPATELSKIPNQCGAYVIHAALRRLLQHGAPLPAVCG